MGVYLPKSRISEATTASPIITRRKNFIFLGTVEAVRKSLRCGAVETSTIGFPFTNHKLEQRMLTTTMLNSRTTTKNVTPGVDCSLQVREFEPSNSWSGTARPSEGHAWVYFHFLTSSLMDKRVDLYFQSSLHGSTSISALKMEHDEIKHSNGRCAPSPNRVSRAIFWRFCVVRADQSTIRGRDVLQLGDTVAGDIAFAPQTPLGSTSETDLNRQRGNLIEGERS